MADQPPRPSAPQPSIDQLRRQIHDERDALAKGFDKLTGEVGEAVDQARRQAAEAQRRARTIAPVVAGAVVSLLAARSVMRRRRRRRERQQQQR